MRFGASYGVWAVFKAIGAVDGLDLRNAVETSVAHRDILSTTFGRGGDGDLPEARATGIGVRALCADMMTLHLLAVYWFVKT